MQKLTPDLHHSLNDRLIDVLQQQSISTISDFLSTDSNKLKQLLNIGKMIEMVMRPLLAAVLFTYFGCGLVNELLFF